MSNFSNQQLRLISELLHDATLEEVVWDRTLATFQVRFNCLRRNVDGSDLDDRIVEFRLTCVTAVAVGYDSIFAETRPSQFQPNGRITAADLANWPFRCQEAVLWINSPINQEALESVRVDWLDGHETALRSAGFTFCLTFDQWGDFGMPLIHVGILAGGDSFTLTSGGVPLALDDWEQQFEAWWQGWKNHWDAKRADHTDDGANEPGEYDTAIPLGEDEAPDPNYRPPSEPAFALEPTDAPPEIILAIRDWFEAHHERDWLRMARVYRSLGKSIEECAQDLEKWKMGHDFGLWGYARSIDEWWLEGNRACAIVRGIEHEMASEGDPEENRESVWNFALRKRGGNWLIDTYSQGWPRFGSAKKLSSRHKPWLKRWASGKVK